MQSARADLSASVCLNPNGSKRAQRAPLASMSTSRGGAPVPRKAASSSTRLTLHPKRTRTPSSKQSLKSECCSCASTDPARSEASQSHRYTEALSGALVPRRSGGGPYLGSHQESSGVIRSHQESSGGGPYLGSHQESSGVVRSHQESSGGSVPAKCRSGAHRARRRSKGRVVSPRAQLNLAPPTATDGVPAAL